MIILPIRRDVAKNKLNNEKKKLLSNSDSLEIRIVATPRGAIIFMVNNHSAEARI